MSISTPDIKLLWGRAAGLCSNPNCDQDLTIVEENGAFNVGEMAHIIDRSPDGLSPRRIASGGSDEYNNLILLCPTCHTKIDRAPEGTYPSELIHEWKRVHELAIRSKGSEAKFENFAQLKARIRRMLIENRMLWEKFGPESLEAENPASNLNQVWSLRKLDRILPNNQKIINMIEANKDLLDDRLYELFLLFKIHAEAFEQNQYARLDNYPTFPKEFGREFEE